MPVRRKVVVGVGFVLLAGIAGLGAWAWWADRTGWGEEQIGRLALSADRRTVWIQGAEYRSDSCYELRGGVEPDGERWAAHLEARRVSDFCTAEGCMVELPGGPVVARPLPRGEDRLPCGAVPVELPEALPDDAEVVPG